MADLRLTRYRLPPNRRQCLQAAVGLAGAGLVSGCGGDAAHGNVLKVFNWSDYLDPTVVPDFELAHGCRIIYDNFSSDSELEARLATGGGAYDVVFPSDRAMHSLVAKGALQPLDHAKLSHLPNLNPDFLDLPFDLGNRYSIPYFWGTVAVGVRTDRVHEEVTGFEPLFDRRYRGKITMLDDLENVVGAVLMFLRLPLNSVEPADLERAKLVLLQQRPLVQAYTSDAYRERLISGQAWVSLGWSGDLLQAAGQRGQIDVVVPRQGTMKWLDSMAIPRRATNVELAHQFIDYLLDAQVAAKNAQHVNYATPNLAAYRRLPAASRADARIYPPATTLDACDWLTDRGEEIEKIEAVWREVRA